MGLVTFTASLLAASFIFLNPTDWIVCFSIFPSPSFVLITEQILKQNVMFSKCLAHVISEVIFITALILTQQISIPAMFFHDVNNFFVWKSGILNPCTNGLFPEPGARMMMSVSGLSLRQASAAINPDRPPPMINRSVFILIFPRFLP